MTPTLHLHDWHSLHLDARQLGMLEAMGIAYAWPHERPAATASAVPLTSNVIALTTAKASVSSHNPPDAADASDALADDKTSKIRASHTTNTSTAQVFDLKKKATSPPSSPPTAPIAPFRPSARATPPRPAANMPTLGSGLGPRPQPEAWNWDELTQGVEACQACGLCQHRRQAVLGMGPRHAKWMIVGEGPGEQEDLQGLPFVGPAGQLLDAMLAAMGLSRETDVYITNAVKCRPPRNRNPDTSEWQQCQPYLMRQIELVQPALIVALGRYAAHTLLDHVLPQAAHAPLGRLRGQVHESAGRPVVVSYHPAYLLRSPAEKGKVWQDLCLAMSQLHHNPLHTAKPPIP